MLEPIDSLRCLRAHGGLLSTDHRPRKVGGRTVIDPRPCTAGDAVRTTIHRCADAQRPTSRLMSARAPRKFATTGSDSSKSCCPMVARFSTPVDIRVSGRTCAGTPAAGSELLPWGTERMHPWASLRLACSPTWWPADGVSDAATAPEYWREGVLGDAVKVAERLTGHWDDDLADGLVRRQCLAGRASRVSPRARWRRYWQTPARSCGTQSVGTKAPSPAEATWWLAGQDGARVRVDLLLSPHPSPKIQMLNWTRVDRTARQAPSQRQSRPGRRRSQRGHRSIRGV